MPDNGEKKENRKSGKVVELRPKLPQDLEAERSILGGLIIKPEQGLPPNLDREDFFDPQHKLVFDAISILLEKGEPVDATTLRATLHNVGCTLGGQFVLEVVDETPDPSNVPYYAKIVRRKSVLRKFIKKANEALDRLYAPTVPEYELELIREVVWEFDELAAEATGPEEKPQAEELAAAQLQLKGGSRGIPTTWPSVDKDFRGLVSGELTVIAGRTTQGKTALGCNFAYNAAVQGYGVLYLTLEMEATDIWERLITIDGGDDSPETHARMMKLPIAVRYQAAAKPKDIRYQISKVSKTLPLAVVVVDYVGLMRGNHPERDHWREMAGVVKELKWIAGEFNVAMVAVAQINREGDDNQAPKLSQLRDTGTLEEHASNVFVVWKPPAEKKKFATRYTGDMVQLLLAKQRKGPAPAQWDMLFERKTGKFSEPEPPNA